jgi:hypothetical protein
VTLSIPQLTITVRSSGLCPAPFTQFNPYRYAGVEIQYGGEDLQEKQTIHNAAPGLPRTETEEYKYSRSANRPPPPSTSLDLLRSDTF